ncbi:hypothetical protein SAMN04488544_2474 [Microlunatus sagamiharensis]|uniref:Uncharacterized protein n=1 Tax=Microlunatus sagamiharensis TaxID=546874 RepID=A0A1H2MQA2_9ACTN|nr:hypothetical protein [Microlunatus sagamiharensis]SDU95155.1 hypothetical protein SAMN04488544_2474 [Microlunatus sagamiharensis]
MDDGQVARFRGQLAFLLVLTLLVITGLFVGDHALRQRQDQNREERSSTSPPSSTPLIPLRRSSVVAASIDRGALSRKQAVTAAQNCLRGADRTTRPTTIHLARRTTTHRVVIFTAEDHIAYVCAGNDLKLYDGPNPPYIDDEHRREPADRLYGFTISASTSTSGNVTAVTSAAYRTEPEVATIQLRLTRGAQTGPWYPAALHDGYAFAEARLDFELGSGDPAPLDLDVEDRALDQNGQPLSILRVRG